MSFDMVGRLAPYGRYIWVNAWSEFRHRYAGTTIGFVWNVLQPLALIGVFSLVFGQIMPVRVGTSASPGLSFLAYLCAGYLPWIGFSECLTRCLNAFLDNAPYLKKLPIPEVVFAAKAAVGALISLTIALGLLYALLAALGYTLGWASLLAVPAALLLIGLGFGLGLLFGTLNVFLRDIGHLIAVILQLWLWCSPIVYTVELVPERLRFLFWFNPIYPYLVAIRGALLDQQAASGLVWLAMIGWTTGTILLGGLVLNRLRGELRDLL